MNQSAEKTRALTCWSCGRRIVCALWPRLLCDHCGGVA